MKSLLAASLLALLSPFALAADRTGEDVPPFWVRPGFKVSLVADKLDEARFMVFDDKGTLYLSQPRKGSIVSLQDKDGDGTYETRADFITGKKAVHSMCFKDGWLYYTSAETGSCDRSQDTDGDGKADKTENVYPDNTLPTRGGHPFQGILVTDDAIYVTVSDPQNMTEDLPSDRKTLYRFDRDGKNKRVFATGIRNTEKLQMRPGTTDIYGLDHGSDNFGKTFGETEKPYMKPVTDNNPPEELNKFVDGGFYGHPFISGKRQVRPEYATRKDIVELANKTIVPAWTFGAHWAGNGFTFLSKDTLKDRGVSLKGDLFCAFHGSWNSSTKVGYRVERVIFDSETGEAIGSQKIVGCLDKDGRDVLGRPVDCAEAPDGTVLFSCDDTKRIYRISPE